MHPVSSAAGAQSPRRQRSASDPASLFGIPIASRQALPSVPVQNLSVEVSERQASLNAFPALSGAVILHEDDNVSEMTKVYTFLSSQKKGELRKLGRVWGCRMAGNKSELIFRAFLFLSECHQKRLDIRQVMASNIHCSSFEEYIKAQELSCSGWKPPPHLSVMRNALVAAGDRVGENGRPMVEEREPNEQQIEERPSAPNFTISEFARLIVLMKDDERVRSALFKLGQELRRCELDSGNTRDAFWGVIEGRFNDQSVLVHFSFTGHIEEADPSVPPLCHRSAELLKLQFRDARSVFTEALDRWARSGQNDPDRFLNFLSKNGQMLYASSKRALIMFVVSRLGTPYEDTFFVEMSSKTIWQGGYEAGMDNLKRGYSNEGDGEASGSKRSKRASLGQGNKRASSELGDIVQSSIDRLVKVVSKSSSTDREELEMENTSADPFNSALKSWRADDSMFEVVESALKALDRAKATDNCDFIQIAQQRYEKALQAYRTMFG